MITVILGTVWAGLSLIGKWENAKEAGWDMFAEILPGAFLWAIYLRCFYCPEDLFLGFLISVIAGCLLLACATDRKTCQVYNFVWWISGAAAVALLWVRRTETGSGGIGGLVLFCLLQLFLFSKMYGRADCYAFCVCAGAETGLGLKLWECWGHMTAAFLLLAVIQAFRRNISIRGRLKEPVPFLPYITAGLLVVLTFHKICGETVVRLW